jgi:hypothetical protein
MATEAYPLSWPAGWPRTPDNERRDGRYHFRKPTSSGRASPCWTFAEARDALIDELRRLGAGDIVLSCNIKPDRFGRLIEPSRRPADQGIAVWFTLNGQPKTMARDTYTRFEENMRALTLTIEAMRAIDRHGGGQMMSRAFAGFTALPPPLATPPRRPCWDVLDIKPTRSETEIRAAYRRRARVCHPDAGGTSEQMAELQAAYEEALREAHNEH